MGRDMKIVYGIIGGAIALGTFAGAMNARNPTPPKLAEGYKLLTCATANPEACFWQIKVPVTATLAECENSHAFKEAYALYVRLDNTRPVCRWGSATVPREDPYLERRVERAIQEHADYLAERAKREYLLGR